MEYVLDSRISHNFMPLCNALLGALSTLVTCDSTMTVASMVWWVKHWAWNRKDSVQVHNISPADW